MTEAGEHAHAARPEGTTIPPVVYAAVFVVYVGLGLVVKSAVLNWIVGPLFLVAVLDIVPRLARAARGRAG